jgi:glycosyltransferase involved in cell wall biosynthesis
VLEYGEGVKLYTAHEHWLVCESHILWRHNREPCSGRECLRCVVRAKRPPQAWRATSLLEEKARHVDEFLALSGFSADKHREFGFPLPMRVFPSFLPDEEATDAAPADAERPSESPYFLFVGRLEAIKGLADVIPEFDAALGAELWIAGTGAQEAELRALARDKPGVRFLGQKTPEELRALYRGAVALIASSLCFEVFPLVVLEAFRESTPVVGRKLGPYPEILQQAGGGLLFGTRGELRAALRRLLTEPGLRDDLGGAGARAFQERWSESVALARYFDLIREVAERRGLREIGARLAPGAARV